MDYFANIKFFQDTFPIPKAVAEKYLKLVTLTQLKVLLYTLSHLAEDPSDEQIASALSLERSDVADSLKFWDDTGILISKQPTSVNPTQDIPSKKIVKKEIIKPSRAEIAMRGDESEELRLLLREAEEKFGRQLNFSEISTFVWLFDEQGMDISLILTLIEFARNENKLNIGFIERTAINWINNGIESITDADRYISDMIEKRTAWKIVEASFGIEPRLASTKELEYSKLWIKDWGFSREILKAAYERCVDAKSKFIMSYTAKILDSWHKSGVTCLADIEKLENKQDISSQKNSIAGYDISAVRKIFNSTFKED